MPYVSPYVIQQKKPPFTFRIITWGLLGLMLVSLGLLVFPWWPRVSYEVHAAVVGRSKSTTDQSHAELTPPGPGNWLIIPTIGVKSRILQGNDISILDRQEGVWNQVGSPSSGNYVVAGHRFKYLPPNATTLYNLDRVNIGDPIFIWHAGQRFEYQAATFSTVDRSSVNILNPTAHRQLTIYTCTDLTASRRLVLTAKPIGPESSTSVVH